MPGFPISLQIVTCWLRFYFFAQMEYDETSARELLEELDGDKSGLIDFQEFCAFIARIK